MERGPLGPQGSMKQVRECVEFQQRVKQALRFNLEVLCLAFGTKGFKTFPFLKLSPNPNPLVTNNSLSQSM